MRGWVSMVDSAHAEAADLRSHIAAAHRMGDGSSWSPPVASWAELADRQVRRYGDKPFLTFYDDDRGERVELSYRTFDNWVAKVANLLVEELGVARGDKVATVMVNHWQTIVVYFACWRAGVCVVPVNVEEPAERTAFILDNAGCVAAFVREEWLDEVKGLAPQAPALRALVAVTADLRGRAERDLGGVPNFAEVVPGMPDQFDPGETSVDDDALIVYTSGTTGAPKGVLLSQRNLMTDADAIARHFQITDADRLLCVLPVHHVNGTVVTHVTPFYAGAGAVLTRRFNSATFWKRVADERVAIVSVVPTLLEYLLEADADISGLDLSRFRAVICGAGPLLVATASRWERRFGVPLQHGYGLSETTCYSCFLPTDLDAAARLAWLTEHGFPSIGCPVVHNEMTILGPDGAELADGERGEICIRGRTVMREYYRRPDANAEAFRHGWFHSGDEGFARAGDDARRYFFITGRLKELIIRGGVNLSPLEIDDVLKAAPGVAFAMAVPFDNRYYGEEVAAYVVPAKGAQPSAEEILAWCAAKLDHKRTPKVVVFGDDVPYTSTGKPKRLELRRRLAGELAAYADTQFRPQHDESREASRPGWC